MFEFSGVTRPLLTFWVQAKVDSVNLLNGAHCRMCATFQSSVSYLSPGISPYHTKNHLTFGQHLIGLTLRVNPGL